jgi:hypothetical protein
MIEQKHSNATDELLIIDPIRLVREGSKDQHSDRKRKIFVKERLISGKERSSLKRC